MPKFYAKLSSFQFDTKAYSRAFDIAINKLYREAAERFLNAALPKVPFRTGFARSAFYQLQQFTGKDGPAAAARQSASGKKKEINKNIFKPHFFTNSEASKYRQNIKDTIFTGHRERLNPSNIVEFYRHTDGSRTIKSQTSGQNFASLEFKKEKDNYTFDFKIDITYFSINDENFNRFAPNSSPWKSFAFGKIAFYDYIKESLDKLPNVLSFLFETTYTLNRAGTVARQRTKRTV